MPRLLQARARQRGDHPFLIWEPFAGDPVIWTYRRFGEDVAQLAAGLAARGLGEGDAVLIHLDNCPEMLLAWHACARIGALAVTTNTRSSPSELAYFAGHCGARAAITQPRFAAAVQAACPKARFVAVTETDGDATAEPGPPFDGHVRFASLLANSDEAPNLAPDPWRACSVQYTSGTTSRPKGVVWTHANALWGAETSAVHEGLTPADVHLVHLPLFHTNALAYSSLATLWAGASLVLVPRFSASRFWEVALRWRCTWSSMIPFNVRALGAVERPKVHAFRYWAPAVSLPDVAEGFGVRTFGWWGMTETITHGIVGSLTEDEPALSLGRCARGYEIAVVGGSGESCRTGETGDLLIRGVPGLSLFSHYLNDAQASEAAFDPSGYMITGDRVTLGDEGLIYFADRVKDMLKVGGENVAASEIERVALRVEGVAEAAAIGRPDPMLDEVPVIFIVPVSGADPAELEPRLNLAFTGQLADFKRPRRVHFVADLPRATLEKVNKAELRARIVADMESGT